MNGKTMAMKCVAFAAAMLCAGIGWADGLPAEVKTEHPRLYGTAADFDRLAREMGVYPFAFPQEKGELRFTVQLPPRGTSKPPVIIFGDYLRPNEIYIQHLRDESGSAVLFLALQAARGGVDGAAATTNAYRLTFSIPLNTPTEIVLTYDTIGKTVQVRAGSQSFPAGQIAGDWKPSNQRFIFTPLDGTLVTNIKMTDLGQSPGTPAPWEAATKAPLDLTLTRAWVEYLAGAERTAVRLANCPSPVPDKNTTECNTRWGGRNNITEPAKRLALAYRMTHEKRFWDGALAHIDRLLKTPVHDVVPDDAHDPAWSQGGRVGAMGIYYDWLYNELGPGLRSELSAKIRETISYHKTEVGTTQIRDLGNNACGDQAPTMSPLGCPAPVTTKWPAPTGEFSIANGYLSGHSASANFGSALGLLALDEQDEVKPMLGVLYKHFAEGYIPARDYYAADGGSHMLFAYAASAGETVDRLTVLNRALQIGEPAITTASAAHMIYPYIYGLRSDGALPARGDNFLFDISAPGVGSMALAAVAANKDQHAANFYRRHVLQSRAVTDTAGTVMERLMYGEPPAENDDDSNPLPLSRRFAITGNVLMRDTWEYDKATLLEFKSSKFFSVNHHHMDQNSYSLYYRAPLLLDSGQYDQYGSNHWHNYYMRSIAHNTITFYDPREPFNLTSKATNLANDGGQWPGPNRRGEPSLDQIKPGAAYALHGIDAYQEGYRWAYTAGNASKAYVYDKIDPNAGFLRSVVFLRPLGDTGKPKVLVFDSVKPGKSGLEITSYLHTVNKPAAAIAPSSLSGKADGRFGFDFGSLPRELTIRNGAGMVTVQALLPAAAKVVISGGRNDGSTCEQAPDPFGMKALVDPTDCRFLVRGADGQWRNYAALERAGEHTNAEPTRTTDIGAWRVEITPPVAPAANTPLYFLNVLHVADSDNQLDGAAKLDDEAVLLSNDNDTVAVRMKDTRTVVFNGLHGQARNLSWKVAGGHSAGTLVFGLPKKVSYQHDFILAADGARATLTLVPDGTMNGKPVYKTSSEGVLFLTP